MRIVLIVLLILFSVILVLMLDILFYKPKIKPQENNEPGSDTEEIPLLSSDSYTVAGQYAQVRIHEIWPLIQSLFQVTQLDHILLYQYHSASDDDPIIFVMENEANQLSLLNACSELMNTAVISHSLMIAIPLTKRFRKQAMAELDKWIADHQIHPALILQEGSDNEDISHNQTYYACVAQGFLHEITLQTTGTSAPEWLKNLSDNLLPCHYTNEAARAMQSLYEQLPWQMRLEMHIPFLHNKAALDFARAVGGCWQLVKAQAIVMGDQLILKAVNEEILNEALQILKKDALKYGVQLETIRKTKAVQPDDRNAFRQVHDALEHSFHLQGIIPTYISYQNQLISDVSCSQIWYMPFEAGKKQSPAAAVLFYQKLLSA